MQTRLSHIWKDKSQSAQQLLLENNDELNNSLDKVLYCRLTKVIPKMAWN